MSGFLYRGRHCGGSREAVKTRSNMNDFSSDETEKGPPLHTHSLREFEQHLNDLKKENFSLKLRIYFLEERIQQKFEDSTSEDVHRKNIELKVEVESLKQELQERQQQLDEALTTAESLTNQNDAEVQRCYEERQQEISHLHEILETKIQLLQEEAKLARGEAEKMAALAASESQRCMTLEMMMEDKDADKGESFSRELETLAENERLIEELSESLRSREEEVASLNKERSSLTHRVTQLEEQLQIMNKSLLQKERDAKKLQEDLGIGKTRKQLEMQSASLGSRRRCHIARSVIFTEGSHQREESLCHPH
ncbi:hypothetical protein MHYP_G00054670 [Metynnis hypsauchen]